ncbi:MAG: YajQ family cyclic di-GMP-binding protein [Gammaproteobacteria bacterium]|nr:YajQ family cyclic di-GMP-binding protein [Gammaproteobacteria bacterium]
MPSFDVVSEVDHHELNNAIDQANREVGNRFDFKGVDARYELKDAVITMTAEAEFQLKQMLEILRHKMTSRKIDVACLVPGDIDTAMNKATQTLTVQQGIETLVAKKIVKMIKEKKMKVQTAIQGEKLRVTGKKRDDLQKVIGFLKEADLKLPLQYENFRD